MIFLLDNIRSKFNIGSIFRTCDAFWIETLVLTWFSVYPPDEEISKTAIWAENVVKWQYFQKTEDAIDYYKNKWRKIISIELTKNSIDIWNYNFEWNEVLIFGNEISWVSKEILELSDVVLQVPMKWKIKESLNVWVTAGIVWARCFEVIKKLK